MTHSNILIVISGCSGGGKSTILSELSQQGYSVIPEVGREIVKDQLAKNGNKTPWENPQSFCQLLIEKSISAYQHGKMIKNSKNNVCFFDRSFLEGICYFNNLSIDIYDHIIHEFRYYKTVFMTPPWREIFCQDDERKHTFDDAVKEYELLVEFYSKSEYQIVQIPKSKVTERAQFIISNLKTILKSSLNT